MLFTDDFWISWLNPWLLCAFLFPICQIGYLGFRERKMWGEQIQPPMPLLFKTCVSGLLMGIILSCFMSMTTFSIQIVEVALVWIVASIFLIGGFRYLCFSYAIGFLSLVHLLWIQFSFSFSAYGIGDPYGLEQALHNFAVFDWLWLAALAHLVEWFFVRLDGLSGRKLITISHRSGKAVNGFLLNRIWPLPCLLFTPTGFVPVPLVIGFASFNLSKPIQQQKRLASTFALLYTLTLFSVLWLAEYTSLGIWIAACITLFGHEGIFRLQRWKERRAQPLYTSDELGLKVLEVLPASPAAKLGIQPGAILQKMNDTSIYTIEDVERITRQTAHCRLELLDEQCDHHFVQKVIYEDDPKHLGIIGAVSDVTVAETEEAKMKRTS